MLIVFSLIWKFITTWKHENQKLGQSSVCAIFSFNVDNYSHPKYMISLSKDMYNGKKIIGLYLMKTHLRPIKSCMVKYVMVSIYTYARFLFVFCHNIFSYYHPVVHLVSKISLWDISLAIFTTQSSAILKMYLLSGSKLIVKCSFLPLWT